MTCKDFQEIIVEALYGDLNVEILARFSQHKESCKTCASLYAGMEDTVKTMKKRQYPEIDPAFSSELWEKIETSLKQEKSRKIRSVFIWRPAAVPSWAYGLAALFLIVVGIYIGRTYFISPLEFSQQKQDQTQIVSNVADTTISQAISYLQRSKNFLLSVVNISPDEESVLDPRRQQDFSRQLIDQADVLYAALNKPDQQQLRRLIDDLRIILLELSNIEVKPGVPAVELVQKSIDRKSIFLKINIEELRAMANRPSNQNEAKENNI